MRSFFKNVLANIVAIIILCAVFFIFFIMMLVFSAMGNDKSVTVKKNSVLTINLKTNIIDSPTEEEMGLFNIGAKTKMFFFMMLLKQLIKLRLMTILKG
jgi:protease-4